LSFSDECPPIVAEELLAGTDIRENRSGWRRHVSDFKGSDVEETEV
jgi:hypothetical protein